MTDIELRLQFLENQLQRNERWTSLADAKAGFVLVAVPTLGGLAASRLVQYAIERYESLIGLETGSWETFGSILYGVLILIVALSAILAVLNAAQVLLPRTKVKGQEIGGNIFFNHISEQEFKGFSDNVLEMTQTEQVQEYIQQVYATSKVCEDKYRHVACAVRTLMVFSLSVVAAYAIALIAAGL